MPSRLLRALLLPVGFASFACSSSSGESGKPGADATADGAKKDASADGPSVPQPFEGGSDGCTGIVCGALCCGDDFVCAVTSKGEDECLKTCGCTADCPKASPCCVPLSLPEGGTGPTETVCVPGDVGVGDCPYIACC
jgi:hypothetical protein